jgi:hypothetical protein
MIERRRIWGPEGLIHSKSARIVRGTISASTNLAWLVETGRVRSRGENAS